MFANFYEFLRRSRENISVDVRNFYVVPGRQILDRVVIVVGRDTKGPVRGGPS